MNENLTTDELYDQATRKSIEDYLNSSDSEEAEKTSKIVERFYSAKTDKYKADIDWEKTSAGLNQKQKVNPDTFVRCAAMLIALGCTLLNERSGHILNGSAMKVIGQFGPKA